jgi:hypothetical protein
MHKLLELKLRLNKKNGQVNISIPRKELDISDRESLSKYKKAFMRLEGFE